MTGPGRTDGLLKCLGVDLHEFEALRARPRTEAVEMLEALKDKVRRNWRRAVFDLHPDRTGGDPEKTALFQELTRIRDALEAFQLPVEVRPVRMVSHFQPEQVPLTPGVTFSRRGKRQPAPRPVGYTTANLKP